MWLGYQLRGKTLAEILQKSGRLQGYKLKQVSRHQGLFFYFEYRVCMILVLICKLSTYKSPSCEKQTKGHKQPLIMDTRSNEPQEAA